MEILSANSYGLMRRNEVCNLLDFTEIFVSKYVLNE